MPAPYLSTYIHASIAPVIKRQPATALPLLAEKTLCKAPPPQPEQSRESQQRKKIVRLKAAPALLLKQASHNNRVNIGNLSCSKIMVYSIFTFFLPCSLLLVSESVGCTSGCLSQRHPILSSSTYNNKRHYTSFIINRRVESGSLCLCGYSHTYFRWKEHTHLSPLVTSSSLLTIARIPAHILKTKKIIKDLKNRNCSSQEAFLGCRSSSLIIYFRVKNNKQVSLTHHLCCR